MLACALLFSAGSAHAHIKMLKPTSWLKDDATGGAQEKKGPCGPGEYDGLLGQTNTPSGVVTEFKGGEEITVEWEETIDHPGYFRVALAENRADLKDPTVPFTDMSKCNVDHSKIPTGPHDNVLADGILIASSAGSRPGHPSYSYKVTLPNKPCEKCTLQLIQFMENHAPGCIYYHCADIKITGGSAGGGDAGTSDAGAADAGTPGAQVDASTATRDSGSTISMTGGGTTSGTGAATLGGTSTTTNPATGSTAGGTGATASGTAGGTGGTTPPAGTGGMAPIAAPDDDDGGCSLAVGHENSRAGLVSMLLVLGVLARRRKQY
jgi:hypothetical protein